MDLAWKCFLWIPNNNLNIIYNLLDVREICTRSWKVDALIWSQACSHANMINFIQIVCILKAVVQLCFSEKIGNREKVTLCKSSDLWGCEVTVGRQGNYHQGRSWKVMKTHTLRGKLESCGLFCWCCSGFTDGVKQGTNPNLIFLSLQCLIVFTPFTPVDVEIPSSPTMVAGCKREEWVSLRAPFLSWHKGSILIQALVLSRPWI